MSKEFIARNQKQLDQCLRLLYAERIPFKVEVAETANRKIYYKISIDENDVICEQLQERYRVLIS